MDVILFMMEDFRLLPFDCQSSRLDMHMRHVHVNHNNRMIDRENISQAASECSFFMILNKIQFRSMGPGFQFLIYVIDIQLYKI